MNTGCLRFFLLLLGALGAGSASAASPMPVPSPVITILQPQDGPLVWATLATALGGLLVAITAIAIALDWPRQRLKGAELSASIHEGPPDRHLITTYVPADSDDELDEAIIDQVTAYYCRLRIENKAPSRFGRLEANNVEVQLIRLWALPDGAAEQLDPVFLPIRLVWAHVHGPVRDRILPGLYNHVDLFRIITGRQSRPWLQFLTEVSPNPFPTGEVPNIKPPGKYRLEIAVAASNAKTKFYDVRIMWSGDYDPKDAAFMEKAVTIEVTPAGTKSSASSTAK